MNIDKILHPLNKEEFENTYFSKKALFIQGEESKFNDIFDWNDINSLLASTFLPNEDILVINSGKFLKYDSIPKIIQEVNNGATMVINKLHQKNIKIGVLTETIGNYFKEPVQVNLYLGQPDIGGFNLHYDTHDVFIFQLSGKKKWEVFEPNLESPIFNMKKHSTDKPDYSPYLNKTLEKGDFLYVPRGHWHCPIAVDTTSLHLTIGIKSRTGLDFIQWLKDELCEDLVWRKEFTFDRKSKMNNLLENLKDKLNSDAFVNQYFKYCDDNLWAHKELNFPISLKHFDEDIKPIVFIRKSLPIRTVENNNVLEIFYQGKKINLSIKTKELIEYLKTGEELNLEKLDDSFGLAKNQIIHVCKTLIQQGILSVS